MRSAYLEVDESQAYLKNVMNCILMAEEIALCSITSNQWERFFVCISLGIRQYTMHTDLYLLMGFALLLFLSMGFLSLKLQ